MKCILIHTPTYLPPIQFQPDELFGPEGEKKNNQMSLLYDTESTSIHQNDKKKFLSRL